MNQERTKGESDQNIDNYNKVRITGLTAFALALAALGGTALAYLESEQRFTRIEQRTEQVDKNLEQMGQRLTTMEQKSEQTDQRLATMEQRAEQMDAEIASIKKQADAGSGIGVSGEAVDKLSQRLDVIEVGMCADDETIVNIISRLADPKSKNVTYQNLGACRQANQDVYDERKVSGWMGS